MINNLILGLLGGLQHTDCVLEKRCIQKLEFEDVRLMSEFNVRRI